MYKLKNIKDIIYEMAMAYKPYEEVDYSQITYSQYVEQMKATGFKFK